MTTKTIQARQTSKGLRIWLEGSALDHAGFNHKAGYEVSLYPSDNRVILDLNTESKRKAGVIGLRA